MIHAARSNPWHAECRMGVHILSRREQLKWEERAFSQSPRQTGQTSNISDSTDVRMWLLLQMLPIWLLELPQSVEMD